MASDTDQVHGEEVSLYEPAFTHAWPRRSLYSMATWVNGLAFRDSHLSGRGKPIIKISEIRSGITAQTKFTEQMFSDEVRVRSGDLLFSWSGQPETSIDASWWRGPEGWLNQHIFRVTPASGVDRAYFYYLLRYLRPTFVSIARNKQTTGLGHVTKRDLERISVALPELAVQRAVAGVLAALDNKIELNRRMSEALEAMARAIFRDWFVDFGPTRAKMEGRAPYLATSLWELFPERLDDEGKPGGWESRPIYAFAEWVNGAAYKNMDFCPPSEGLPVIKIAELKNGITAQTKFTNTALGEKYRIRDGELLFSWSGNPDTSIDAFVWLGGDAWLNQHIFAVRLNGESGKAFLFSMLKQLMPEFAEIARNKQTTGLGHVTKADMQRRLLATSSPTVGAFERVVGPLYSRLVCTAKEAHTLAALRDTLLPKLISGELRINDAEGAIEAA